jgi:hypothetical protein
LSLATNLRHYAPPERIRQQLQRKAFSGVLARDCAAIFASTGVHEFADRIGNYFQFERAIMLAVPGDSL